MKGGLIFIILSLFYSISFAHAGGCGDCDITKAQMTNVVLANTTNFLGTISSPYIALEEINYTYCGCPDIINYAIVNSTDLFGRELAPVITSEKVNFTYIAALSLTKQALLVTNMTQVGENLALLEYHINVNNTGEVNLTGIVVNDSLLGGPYYLGKLLPNQNVSISPAPTFAITGGDLWSCWINNTANATGKDRCCQPVGSEYASDNVSINLRDLEDILRIYNHELTDSAQVIKIKIEGDFDSVMEYEDLLRIQAFRLKTFEDFLYESWEYI